MTTTAKALHLMLNPRKKLPKKLTKAAETDLRIVAVFLEEECENRQVSGVREYIRSGRRALSAMQRIVDRAKGRRK